MRDELRAMGFGFYTETGHESHTILTPSVPEGIRFADMYEEMRRRGYIIYGCKDDLKDKFFQVANMGELSDEQVTCFLGTLRLVMADLRRRARERDTARPMLPAFQTAPQRVRR